MPKPDKTPRQKSLATKTISVDMAARTVRHYITCPTIDEDGDVILPRGADISRFKDSSCVFLVHQYSGTDVMGRCMGMTMQDDGIIATTRFSPRPPSLPAEQEWLPDTILWLYNVGDIKGWSIGFSILDARNPTKQDREKYGPELQRVITRWRMLEYSVAPLPANGDALTLSVKGILSSRLADQLKSGAKPTIQRVGSSETPIVAVTSGIPTSQTIQPVTPRETIKLSVPAAPVIRKHIVFVVPPARQITPEPAPDIASVIATSADIALRKLRGEICI
jgi:hypothetical protein